MGRRHDSLIPLSREHHYALMLCLEIHKGLPLHLGDSLWVQSKTDDVISFFDNSLVTHFRAEEEVLFPAMSGFSDTAELITNLLMDHRQLEGIVARLRTADAGDTQGVDLMEFAGRLEFHVRKEERELFPIYENLVPEVVATEIEQEDNRAGGDGTQTAQSRASHMKPKYGSLFTTEPRRFFNHILGHALPFRLTVMMNNCRVF